MSINPSARVISLVSSAHFQTAISHSFFIGIGLVTPRWRSIELSFYPQIESLKIVLCAESYDYLKLTVVRKPFQNFLYLAP